MLVLGNGESRKAIDISRLKDFKIGCNAVFRDHTVDHLICVDRRMMNEALDAGANLASLVYTRKDWFNSYKDNFKRIRLVPDLPYAGSERPDDPWHWGSGPYAVLLAAKISKNKTVKLLGFDLYGIDNKVNNVYKDTPNYDNSEKRAVDPRYWIYQIGKVIECFSDVNFTIYQEDDWQLPKAWNYTNVTVDSISNIYYNT
jgi:hypothetical protein